MPPNVTRISCDNWIDPEIGFDHRIEMPLDEWLDRAFFGMPEDGWCIDLNIER